MMSARFVFLLCSERSGSNLLTRMMDANPRVCGPPPSHLIRTMSRNLLRYGDLHDNAHWEALTEDVSDLMGAQLGSWRTHLTGAQLRAQAGGRSLSAIVRAVYEAEAAASDADVIFIKENRAWRLLPYLRLAFPDAPAVLLTRDPRDMALSWKRSANHPGGVVKGAAIWQEDQHESLIARAAAPDRLPTCRYEDLTAAPESVLQTLCAALDLPWHAAMLQFHDQPQTQRNAARISNWENLARPVMRDNTQKWKTSLSDDEIQFIEGTCRTEMDALGYACATSADDDRAEALRPALLESAAHDAALSQAPRLSDEEQRIRDRRLAVIQRIINRPVQSILATS